LDAEDNFPLEAADQRLAELVRIKRGFLFQPRERVDGIMQRTAQRDFAHPDRRAEAMGMTGLVVHGDLTGTAGLDRARNGIQVAVEQVDLAAVDAGPSAPDDPGNPA